MHKEIKISAYKSQRDKNGKYVPGFKPYDTDFYTEMDKIKNGYYIDLISKCRSIENKAERDDFKCQKLPSITISALVAKHRKTENIIDYTGLLNIDIDQKENEHVSDWNALRDLIFKNEKVVCSFKSASGSGLSFVIKVNPKDHKDVFYSVRDELEEHLGVKSDKGVNDYVRLRFVSYDPECRIRYDYDNIPVTLPSAKYLDSKKKQEYSGAVIEPLGDADSDYNFDQAVKRASSGFSFVDGQKHFFLVSLSGACNMMGMSQAYLEQNVIAQYGSQTNISNGKLILPIQNTYKTYKHQHGQYKARRQHEKLNEILTRIFINQWLHEGKYPSETDLSAIAETNQANIDRVEYVYDRVFNEYSEEFALNQPKAPGLESILSQALVDIDSDETKFWYYDDKRKIGVDKIRFKRWLTSQGIYRYRPNTTTWSFVMIKDNVVSEIIKADIKKIVFDHIEERGSFDVYQHFATHISGVLSDDFLEILPECEIEISQDTRNEIRLYFKNKVVCITKGGISFTEYKDLQGYIWKTHIIDRDFEIVEKPASDFEKFVWNISGQTKDRYAATCSVIGYLMHGYKDKKTAKAIILNDETISDNPEGGTGKGVFINAIKRFKKIESIDGKAFKFEKSFLYQRVSLDTEVLAFEDVQRSFDFERLFSVITDGIEVEKKNQPTFYIPFEKSPKIIITTNYAVKGAGNSNERRKFELEFAQYYNAKLTPFDEFGKLLFDEWDADEFSNYDNYIANCCKLYLREGLIEPVYVNLGQKKLIVEIGQELIDFMDDNLPERVVRTEFYNQFIAENPNIKQFCPPKRFYKSVAKYCEYRSIKFEEQKSNGLRYFVFVK